MALEQKAVAAVKAEVAEVENFAVAKIHATFDDFFHEYALAKAVPLAWKNSIKLHLKSIGCLKDPVKWAEGLKHFGC